MAFKTFPLDDHTTVTIYKRKASRSLRLSVAANGEVRVSIPVWTPYIAGLQFAKSRASWIAAQRKAPTFLAHGQAVGKFHHLEFVPIHGLSAPTTRVSETTVTVKYPSEISMESQTVQMAAEKACIRALRSQAEQLLPQRLEALARQHGFSYASVTIKQLKSRWGSCDQHKHIVLNLFLMQLPWDLIDYVLLHELTHTEVLRHGPDFWQVMERLIPNLGQRRKAMRDHQPILTTSAV